MSYVSFNRAKTGSQLDSIQSATNGKIYVSTDGHGIYIGNDDGSASKVAVGTNDLTTFDPSSIDLSDIYYTSVGTDHVSSGSLSLAEWLDMLWEIMAHEDYDVAEE